MASIPSHVLCVHGPWLNGHVSDSRLYAMYFRAVSLCLRAIRAMALGGGGDDKRAAAAYPKLRLPSSYLLSSVLEKEEGYVVFGSSQFKSAPRSPLPPRLSRPPLGAHRSNEHSCAKRKRAGLTTGFHFSGILPLP